VRWGCQARRILVSHPGNTDPQDLAADAAGPREVQRRWRQEIGGDRVQPAGDGLVGVVRGVAEEGQGHVPSLGGLPPDGRRERVPADPVDVVLEIVDRVDGRHHRHEQAHGCCSVGGGGQFAQIVGGEGE
jgi:hypothetical protein